MTASTFTLSIGRRIGSGEDLAAAGWRSFRAAIEGLVADTADQVHFVGLGGGTWEGRYEEAATWVYSAAPGVSRFFERQLADLAARYGQDAIAVTEGRTQFIQPAGAALEGVA